MPTFWSRRKERRGGLSRVWRWLWLLRGGSRASRGFASRGFASPGFASPGFGKSSGGSGRQAEWEEFQRREFEQGKQSLSWDELSLGCRARDVPGCARMEKAALGKLEEPGACRNSGGGKAQQEKLDICSAIRPLEEDGWDEPSLGCRARDVPRCARMEKALGKLEEPGACRNSGGGKTQQEKLDICSAIQPLEGDGWDEPSLGCRARDVPRCARMEKAALGKLEEPGACRNSGGGKGQQEKLDICSAIQPLEGDGWDEASVGCRARDGNVPREGGGGLGKGMDQPQLPAQGGASEDEEGLSGGSSPQLLESRVEGRDTPTAPGEDLEPRPAEGTPGEEPRSRVWEKLERLGEPMERWEGQPLGALAARLAELALQTHTHSYPTERGAAPRPRSRQPGTGNAVVAAATARQDLGVSVSGSRPNFLGMLSVSNQAGGGSDGGRGTGPLPGRSRVLRVEIEDPWRREFPAVWARYRMDCGRVAEEVDLDGSPVPPQREQPLPPDEREAVEELLPELLKEGIVVKGASDYNNLVVPTRKGTQWRLTLKCKALNEATPTEPEESLSRDRILASVPAGSRWFSVLDLACASFAIPLAPSCWHRFAFTFQGQQFLFTRLPPGFRSTGSITHRRVARMLSRLGGRGDRPWAFNYSDDILIAGRTAEEAAARTRRVLELIQDAGFKAKWEKAQLVRSRVTYLGVAVGAAGRGIPDAALEELRSIPSPRDAKELRSLLGKFGYWRSHIPDYSELARPLHRLTGDGVRWEWQEEQQQRLRELREALVPVLPFPDKSRPFLIRMSLHAETAGAALLQEQDEGGALAPVQHISRVLEGQKSLPLEEKGCVAAAWAVQEFQPFTGPAPILLQLPHCPGKFLSRGQALGPRGPRLPEGWALLLVPERAPKKTCGYMEFPEAPPLRRLPPDVPGSDVWFLASYCSGRSLGYAATNLEGRWLLGASPGGSRLEVELEALWELLERHQSSSRLYLYSNCECLVEWLARRVGPARGWNARAAWKNVRHWFYHNPGKLQLRRVRMAGGEDWEEKGWIARAGGRARAAAGRAGPGWMNWEPSTHERREIIAQCHRGHDGEEETLARVRAVAWWSWAPREVKSWVRACPRCGDGPEGPQRPEGPWSCLSVGVAGDLPENPQGFRALLVVRDEESGWVDAFPLGQLRDWEATLRLRWEVLEVLGKVGTVRVPAEPPWLGDALCRFELRGYWDRLERGRDCPVAASLRRVAQKVGEGWAEMLPLILAGVRAGGARRARLEPLLSVPGLALEVLWEEMELRHRRKNELAWLGGMRLRAGYRDRVRAALNMELD
ncbi:uncharacterized protein LOC127465822 [Manacus candei]|uniref:uncharacterized protein LOC127465822 n=1 Tax=Manacus candei TaxID=415023 RepID=UPI002225CE7B|nr:uncharacterized protein LOC127465822 [Manacus candei]